MDAERGSRTEWQESLPLYIRKTGVKNERQGCAAASVIHRAELSCVRVQLNQYEGGVMLEVFGPVAGSR